MLILSTLKRLQPTSAALSLMPNASTSSALPQTGTRQDSFTRFPSATAAPRFGLHNYEFTNRGIDLLIKHAGYPFHFVDHTAMKGLKRADLCCGGGNFVREIRKKDPSIDIVGVDRNRHEEWAGENGKYMIQASIAKLPFADNSMDMLYCAMGPYTFFNEEDGIKIAGLKEAQRVLKPGGKFRMGEIIPDEIRRLVNMVPGLKVTDETNPDFHAYGEPQWVEITKTDNIFPDTGK